jgi:predicted ATPase/DNA-binding SARP family transcriptional activator
MARLSLSLFGSLQFKLDGRPVGGIESDKARALLAYLAVEAGRPHRREALAGLLWPELAERAARHNLSQALFNLRQAIADQAAVPPFLLVARDAVQFNLQSDHWVDVGTFSALVAACEAHRHRQLDSCPACAQRLAQAAELYAGGFLAQFSLAGSIAFEEWALLRREQLQQLVLRALESLASYHERRGAYEQAHAYAARLLEIDPWREAAHRQVMRVLTLAGQRSQALAQYERCCQRLAADLGVEPEAETQALYARIRDAEEGALLAGEQPALPMARPHNLPPQLTPFLGRERELNELGALLANPACRLITIVGPGGAGKTRLALQAANEQLDMFPGGAWLTQLAALSSPELVVSAIADVLRLERHGPEALRTQLVRHLADRELLLVLDNFEHLLSEAPLLAELLRQAPGVTILVTSRERLSLQGEWLLQLGGLPFPTHDAAGAAEDSSAVELFLQSARRVLAGFAPAADEQAAIALICRLVEGMPLAIELAAAWVRALSCAEIAQEIQRSLAILTTSLRDVPARHRSLRAVFDHSWDLLSPPEHSALRRLAVFQGGFRREAALQVAGASLPLLAALVDKSLLQRGVAGQYSMHELARQYAWEQLQQAGEHEGVRRQHMHYFLELAEAAEPQLSAAEQHGLDRLEREHGNLRMALEWALAQGEAEIAARFGAALWRFWWIRNHLEEGCRWLERALALEGVPPPLRAKALHGAGVLTHEQGNYEQARAAYEESLAVRRAQGDTLGVAASLNSLGVVALDQCDYERARALFEESLALKRTLGDQKGIAGSLNNLGLVVSSLGDYVCAERLYEESLALSRQLGSRLSEATVLGNLGAVALQLGDAGRAESLFEAGLALFEQLGDKDGVAECLEGLAGVAGMHAAGWRVARLCGAAEALREAIGTPLIPIELGRYQAIRSAARAVIGPDAFETHYRAGRAMTLEQAIAYARARSQS